MLTRVDDIDNSHGEMKNSVLSTEIHNEEFAFAKDKRRAFHPVESNSKQLHESMNQTEPTENTNFGVTSLYSQGVRFLDHGPGKSGNF